MKKIIIAAVTLDGKIAKNSNHDVDWTSKQDKQFFRDQTMDAGVVVFGSNTYKAMGRPMPKRLNIIMTRKPEQYQNQIKENLLEFTSDTPRIIIDSLEQRGYTKVVVGGGSAVYSLFLQANLVDEIYLNIAPKIFGTGINLFKELDINDIDLELIQVGKLGDGEVLLKYKILKL